MKTGGGHKASAKSVADSLELAAPGRLDVPIVIISKHSQFINLVQGIFLLDFY